MIITLIENNIDQNNIIYDNDIDISKKKLCRTLQKNVTYDKKKIDLSTVDIQDINHKSSINGKHNSSRISQRKSDSIDNPKRQDFGDKWKRKYDQGGFFNGSLYDYDSRNGNEYKKSDKWKYGIDPKNSFRTRNKIS